MISVIYLFTDIIKGKRRLTLTVKLYCEFILYFLSSNMMNEWLKLQVLIYKFSFVVILIVMNFMLLNKIDLKNTCDSEIF
jgi:hypothetical protein